MSFGIQVFDKHGSQRFVDSPFWVVDMISDANGSGSRSYNFDTSLFRLEAIPFCWRYGKTPSFNINGTTVNYSNATSLWFFVRLVAL